MTPDRKVSAVIKAIDFAADEVRLMLRDDSDHG